MNGTSSGCMTEYMELHCHSHFSLLDGASSPNELINQAAALGMSALALTDHDAVYGVPAFVQAARAQGIQPIIGAEVTLESGHHLTLLVETQTGWNNLCHLITTARLNAPKGQARLPDDVLVQHTAGLIALSGCRKGAVAAAVLRRDYQQAKAAAEQYLHLFGAKKFWIELQHHLLPEDNRLVADLVALADHLGLGYVASNNVHYARRETQALQDVLVSIRHNTPLDDTFLAQRPNAEYHLKSGAELLSLFARYPQAIAHTQQIADRCAFTPVSGLQDLPAFPTPADQSADDYLRHLCEAALLHRYGTVTTRSSDQLRHELEVITRSQLANYFLIVWDIVRYARENHIRCQGRGSAANSLVAYLLNISPVDPIAHNLVFERFLSAERAVAPDIDIDFDAERREEVIAYIYERYGREHASMACTFVTYRRKSSLRDVGKALGLLPDTLDEVIGYSEGLDTYQPIDGISPKTLRQLRELSEEIRRFPRHLGIHNGGFVLSGRPLSYYLPTEPATMPGRTVVQWDKTALEDMGIVKIDILGLRMLSAVSECLDLIHRQCGARPDLDRLPLDDKSIYDFISSGDTVGIFQVESRAQAQMLPRMKPRCFNDLIVAISLIRPGPIQGDMVHPYLRRRLGQEAVSYYHPHLKAALEETLGVILFQEQCLKVARDLAAFTAGQGEQLRRALGAKDAEEAVEVFHTAFVAGAEANGVPEDTAELVFSKLRAFGSYSFPKSHAAAFAVIVYQSAWLKRYFPAAFLTAILNNQPMGFWSPAVIVNDAKRHNIPLYPIHANASNDRCTVEGEGIRMGFNYVKGFGAVTAARVVESRKDDKFHSLADFCRKTQLPKRLIENLIWAGGFDWLNKSRRDLVWELGGLSTNPAELPLIIPEDPVALSPVVRGELLQTEFRLTGVSLHEHPMQLYRAGLKRRGIVDSKTVRRTAPKKRVVVAGLNVVHQAPPTAKGFHFITLEDEYGFMNIIVRPRVYARFRAVIRSAPVLVVRGTVEREGSVTNVLALSVTALGDSQLGF